ncbi:unnamed protein product [Coccothraustes coccothraustes]
MVLEKRVVLDPYIVGTEWAGEELVLQLPVWALLEEDTVTLRCWGWWNKSVTLVSFYRKEKELGELCNGTELSLTTLQQHHSSRYCCRGWVDSKDPLEEGAVLNTHVVSTEWARGGAQPGPQYRAAAGGTAGGADTFGAGAAARAGAAGAARVCSGDEAGAGG